MNRFAKLISLSVLAAAVLAGCKTPKDPEPDPPTPPVVDPGSISKEATKELRLTEIGTYGNYKFIEIYNPTEYTAPLEGLALWKNGELLYEFAADATLVNGMYGVFKAKEASFTIPATATALGETEVGLSATKSLSVELRYEGVIIDAFANTINPGVGQMTVEDWDGEVAKPNAGLCDFFRRSPTDKGWYAIGVNATGSPGVATPSADAAKGMQLYHQLFAEDAVADLPYFTGVEINPDEASKGAPVGLTPDKNTIRFRAYSDVHWPEITVTCTVDGVATPATHIDGAVYEITPTLSGGTAAGIPVTLKISVTNALGNYPAAGDKGIEVLVFPAGQAFGSWDDIRLNEIRTTDGDGIELYNTSSNPVVVAGMRIRKDKDRIFTIPGYMAMKGKGFAVLGCDDDVYSGNGYLALGTVSNGLSGTKALLLELRRPKLADDPGGKNGTNIDSFVNTSLAAPDKDNWNDNAGVERAIPKGAGRATDGTGDWYVFTGLSMGMSNTSSVATTNRFTHKYSQAGGSDE